MYEYPSGVGRLGILLQIRARRAKETYKGQSFGLEASVLTRQSQADDGLVNSAMVDTLAPRVLLVMGPCSITLCTDELPKKKEQGGAYWLPRSSKPHKGLDIKRDPLS